MRRRLEFDLDEAAPEQAYDQIANALPTDKDVDLFGRVRFAAVEARRPEHLVIHGEGRRIRVDATIDFAPHWGGTRVTTGIELELRGLVRPFGPLLARILSEERIREALDRARRP